MDLLSLDAGEDIARELASILQDTLSLEVGDLYTKKYVDIYNSYFTFTICNYANE